MHFPCDLWIVCQLSVSCLSVVCRLSANCLSAAAGDGRPIDYHKRPAASRGWPSDAIVLMPLLSEAGGMNYGCFKLAVTRYCVDVGAVRLPCLPWTKKNTSLKLAASQLVSVPIAKDLNALGAVDVNEVSQADWDALPTWPLLITCERLRILALMP